MSPQDPDLDGLFPRDLLGRMALGMASVLLAPICGLILFGLLFGPAKPVGWGDRILLLLIEEFLLGMFLFFSVGLLWAVAAPKWLERWKQPSLVKLGIGLMALVCATGLYVFWALLIV